jgi:IS5 family transposase
MRPKERRDRGPNDPFTARLDQIVDMNHALAKLARAICWGFLEKSFGAVDAGVPGRAPLATRLMAGLAILKRMRDLPDAALCGRWLENPYSQLFCGEEFFQHKLTFDRSSLTRWRPRMGEAAPSDFSKVIADTAVQEKAISFQPGAKLMPRARARLVRLATTHGVSLRQSYERVGKGALIARQRYAHAKQFKRANKALRKIRTWLGRIERDIIRKTRDNEALRDVFRRPLYLAKRVREQRQKSRGRKVYSLHAPEAERRKPNASARARRASPMSSG